MRWLILALLLAMPAAAHAQSCTPNNNNLFTINGNTLSGSGLSTGTYTAGVIVNMGGVSNSGMCFPVTVTGQSGGGTGCSDSDQSASVLPAGWTCDTAWSDDFNSTGTPYGSKWKQESLGLCSASGGRAAETIDYSINSVYQSAGALHMVHTATSTTDTAPGIVAQMGARTNTGGYPFFDWYREVRFQFVSSGLTYSAPMVQDFGYVLPANYDPSLPAHGSQFDMLELDTPEVAGVDWFLWAEPENSSIIFKQFTDGTEWWGAHGGLINNGWHTVGVLKQGDIFQIYEDGHYVGKAVPVTPELAYEHGAVFLDNTGWGGTCPTGGTGNADMQVDYVHVYHSGGSPPPSTPSITVNGSSSGVTVASGVSMTVAVANGPSSDTNDILTICNAGVTSPAPSGVCSSSAGYDWKTLHCDQSTPSGGLTSATCALTAPPNAGSYQAVLLASGSYPRAIYASAPFTVTGGGGATPAVVNTAGTATTLTGNQQCVWQPGFSINAGDTVVGFTHSASDPDGFERYPSSITDNVGNTYTQTAGVRWFPFTEDVGIWYLANVQGNPNTFTLHFPGGGNVGCHIGLVEYSGPSHIDTVVGPVADNVSTTPTLSITPTASSRIWAWGAMTTSSRDMTNLTTSGYTPLVNAEPISDNGIWGSNTMVTGTQTVSWDNTLVAGPVCADGSISNVCGAVMGLVAVSSAGPPPPAGTTVSINGSSSGVTVSANSAMTISVTGATGNPQDRFFTCQGTPSGQNCNYSGWAYLGSCSSTPGAGVTSGSCTVSTPSSAGSYGVYFYAGTATQYSDYLASAPFTVTGGGPPPVSGCTAAASGWVANTPSPVPCPVGVSAPNGYHWNLTFEEEFTSISSLDPNKWCLFSTAWGSGCQNATIAPGLSLDSTNGLSIDPGFNIRRAGIELCNTLNTCPGGASFMPRFGYFEWSVKEPTDVYGEGDGYHTDVWLRSYNWSVEDDIDEKVLGTANRTYTHHFVEQNPLDYGGPYLDEAFQTVGLYWQNDGSPHGSEQVYFNGSPQGSVYSFQDSSWDGGSIMIMSNDGCNSYDINDHWGGGSPCNPGVTTAASDPFQFRYFRYWQLAPN